MNELLSLLSQIESRRIENITKIYFSPKIAKMMLG